MNKNIYLAAFLPSILFPVAAFLIGLRTPLIFDALAFLKDTSLPAVLFVLAFGAVLIAAKKFSLIKNNFDGLLLLFLFALGYFFMTSIFNKPELNANNVYFAADSWSWYRRLVSEAGWSVGARAVHPFAHLLFRPLIVLLSAFTGGNRFYAALILLASTGGGCVFWFWKITRALTQNRAYAVLCASLLGVSSSHLIFASVLETYIFSAFFLLFFLWLLISDKADILLIAVSIVTFGITLTNIVQQGLMLFTQKPNVKRTSILFMWVILFSLSLNIFSKYVYPLTEYFFIPQNLTSEQKFSQEVDLKRVGLMAEDLFLYNVVAPQPYFSAGNEKPKFVFLSNAIQNYVWFGWVGAALWAATLVFALVYVFLNKPSAANKKMICAMLACLLFNFILHIGYGFEPFLYSADWTYALILFAALIFQRVAQRVVGLTATLFLILFIMLNNLWFMYLLARLSSKFLAS